MQRFRNFVIGCVFALFAVTVARADEWNRMTVIDVPYPVQVDTFVLQPGRYVIRLLEPTTSLTMVQILSSDEKKIFATIQGTIVTRPRITNKTEFWFWKTPKGRPRIVRAWFYPGQEQGVEVINEHRAAR